MANAVRDRVLAAALALVLGAGTVALWGAAGWIGRPFPGFLVLENRVVASAGLARWPAVAQEDIYQHQVVAVDGRVLASAEHLWEHVQAVPEGTPLVYRFRRGDLTFERSIATRRFDHVDFALLFGAYLLNGLVMGAVALAIRHLRGSHPLSNATFPLLLASALWGLSAMDLYGPYRLFRVHAFCEVMLAPAALHMALAFPQPGAMARRRPWLVPGVYAVAALLAVVNQVWLLDADVYVASHGAAVLALGCALALLVLSQVVRFLRSPSFEARQRIKVLALGTAFSLAPLVFVTLAAALGGGQASQNVIALTAFLFPISIGYSALRHNLLDVDALMRRSLGYGLLTVLVASVYAGSIALAEAWLEVGTVERSPWVSAGLAALFVTGMLPLRDHLQSRVDQLFFRSAYDFRRTLERTSARLAAVTSLEVIVEEIGTAVEATLHPEAVTLLARRGKEEEFELLSHRGVDPGDVAEPLELAEFAAGPFELAGGRLGVPLRTEHVMVGLIVLGRRRSGRAYGGDDRRFLGILANQGAVAIRNSLTLERLRRLNADLESLVGTRTRELSEALAEVSRKNEALEELSSSDLLTGLRTRRYLMEFLEREFARSQRHGARFALALLDIDHFKDVNDRFGHLAGDAVLRRVGEIVREGGRATDSAGRYGGEEILLVLCDAGLESASIRAERLRAAIEGAKVELPDGRRVHVTVSIGVAQFEPSDRSIEAVIEAADRALYRAKSSGRNRVEVAREASC
jgi:diguanylate cyclase (GGDEF)-like protein